MNDYLGTLSRHKVLILLVAAIMGAVAYLVTIRQPARYQATSKLLVNQTSAAMPSVALNPPFTDPAQFDRLTSTQIHISQIPAVARDALLAARVHQMTPDQLLANVTLSEEANADIIDVAVTAATPQLAERLSAAFANAIADYQAGLTETQLSRQLSAVQRTIDAELRSARDNRARLTGSASFQQLLSLGNQLAAASAARPRSSVLAAAAQSAIKTAPKPSRNTALAVILGLLLGGGLAFLFDSRDRRVRTTSEIAEVLGLNLLARIPAPRRRRRSRPAPAVTMLSDPGSVQAESVKMLQANLELARLQGPEQAVLFTSAIGQEGKSTTVANLAVSLAQAGRRVVVVDADLRSPSLSRLFDVPEQPGLAELALGAVAAERAGELLARVDLDAALTPASVRGALQLLPAGRREEQPDRLLSSPALPAVFAALRTDTDWILVDTPPLTRFYDSLIVSQHVDALVAVARVGFVERPTLAEFGRLLASARVLSLGYVATGVGQEDTTEYELPSTQLSGERSHEGSAAPPPPRLIRSRAATPRR
jgi:capsular exopolysaccharide synthesis family protein